MHVYMYICIYTPIQTSSPLPFPSPLLSSLRSTHLTIFSLFPTSHPVSPLDAAYAQRVRADAATSRYVSAADGLSPNKAPHGKLRELLQQQQQLTREEQERLRSAAARRGETDDSADDEERVATGREWYALGRLVAMQPAGDVKVRSDKPVVRTCFLSRSRVGALAWNVLRVVRLLSF